MKNSVWCILLSTTLLAGCCHIIKTKRLKEGGWRPKCPRFSLARKEFQYNGIVDTSAIYVEKTVGKQVYHDVEERDTVISGIPIYYGPLYTFFRFFGDGQVYYANSVDHEFPTNNDINNFRTGLIGYYTTDPTDSTIKIQLFVPINMGQYHTYFGTLSNDTIVLTKKKGYIFYGLLKEKITPPIKAYKVKKPWMALWKRPDW